MPGVRPDVGGIEPIWLPLLDGVWLRQLEYLSLGFIWMPVPPLMDRSLRLLCTFTIKSFIQRPKWGRDPKKHSHSMMKHAMCRMPLGLRLCTWLS